MTTGEHSDGVENGEHCASALPRLVLAGGGHAHLGVLADWISHRPADIETWLITPEPFSAYSGMIPGWMAGFYNPDQLRIDLRPLADRAGVKLVLASVCGLEADHRRIILSDGRSLAYDWLSLAVGGEVDVSTLALLGNRLLPVRPSNAFTAQWPGVLKEAALLPRYRLIVVGGGAAGVELALAAMCGLRNVNAQPSVTIVTDDTGLVAGHCQAVRMKVRAALVSAGIKVRLGHAAGTSSGLLLADGTTLNADCVIAATGSKAPHWLKNSGLMLNSQGFLAIDADLRSQSHSHVFAAGDIVARMDRNVARSGVHAVKAGPVLAANLRAAISGGDFRPYLPKPRTLYLLATADRRAILSWGAITHSGRIVWRLKDWIDRRFVMRFARLGLAKARSI